jgi:hypothetical protein
MFHVEQIQILFPRCVRGAVGGWTLGADAEPFRWSGLSLIRDTAVPAGLVTTSNQQNRRTIGTGRGTPRF